MEGKWCPELEGKIVTLNKCAINRTRSAPQLTPDFHVCSRQKKLSQGLLRAGSHLRGNPGFNNDED